MPQRVQWEREVPLRGVSLRGGSSGSDCSLFGRQRQRPGKTRNLNLLPSLCLHKAVLVQAPPSLLCFLKARASSGSTALCFWTPQQGQASPGPSLCPHKAEGEGLTLTLPPCAHTRQRVRAWQCPSLPVLTQEQRVRVLHTAPSAPLPLPEKHEPALAPPPPLLSLSFLTPPPTVSADTVAWLLCVS